jgi:serine/threonine protein kinase
MLKRKLKLLHYFQIIHLDVKPDNIMFSPAKEGMVFIDYGFSRLTSALPGYKSFTNFTGSLNYCSEPMKRLFSDKGSMAEVDLYYNDANALNISIAEMGKAR